MARKVEVQAPPEAEFELREMKATIVALRGSLEEVNHHGLTRVQEAVATRDAEVRELKTTIQALRDQMERMRFDADQRVQAAVAQSVDGRVPDPVSWTRGCTMRRA